MNRTLFVIALILGSWLAIAWFSGRSAMEKAPRENRTSKAVISAAEN